MKQSVIQRVFTVATYVRKKPYANYYGKFISQLPFMHECETQCNREVSYCRNLCKEEILWKVLWHLAFSFPLFPNQQYSDWWMNTFRITGLLLKKNQEWTSHILSEGTSVMLKWDFNHLYANHEDSYPRKPVYLSHLYIQLQNRVVWNSTNLQLCGNSRMETALLRVWFCNLVLWNYCMVLHKWPCKYSKEQVLIGR